MSSIFLTLQMDYARSTEAVLGREVTGREFMGALFRRVPLEAIEAISSVSAYYDIDYLGWAVIN